ncbi:MAG: hypothetical protein ACRERC_18485 [Candidatus Binatia bacterium]
MELIVKIDLKRAKDPAAHVSRLLDVVAPSASTEEVFPGLRSGASAGLVTVRLPCARGSKAHRASVKALREDTAVAYVEEPKPRRAL